ncbi:bifunctional UDP-N-acetylglucosamine diphosphorylase/glucosamine-1-phosphate N-acetyltransferase GlmU [Salinarimonas ramus]|uniref:Bifunctional protein GlmU n=1 Tax=Salinarimonas ramus TaxID=690164 RepID=A0A917QFZ0_9HYPH|nr:bifunctional UDP-N-acetylglucosamine diphosphorylase/glucosamine-1-phosphate N-acetyltransferase GlmU [Salinarimonas ramus]GGK48654.1 bifunctional protein GlmU [Salinarimonas ramus]
MTDDPSRRTCLAIVLAAGEGTRMRSDTPKVLHRVAARSMLAHALDAVRAAGADRIAVVVGPGREDVAEAARRVVPDASVFVQAERLGTAHAVLAARAALAQPADDVVVAYADTPLVEAETFARLRAPLAEGAAVTVLGFEAADPTGYGRVLRDGETVRAIREHRDANDAERAVTLCNAGLMALSGSDALSLLDAIGNENAKGEYYLTDAVEIARARGRTVACVVAPEWEVQGVNDRVQLAHVERTLQERLRERAMRAGVTMVDPESVFLAHDTVLGRDVVLEPSIVFGPGVVVESGATIHAFSHLEGARIAAGASVGPFARLRPGADIGKGAKVGNFVEVKKAKVGAGAKLPHLSYVGDAEIGAKANLGAGTITCNYDGFDKHLTRVGEGAFVGSNSSLVAPVTVGAGAFVGSGSVVTQDVPADALALARGRQAVKDGWAVRFRAEKAEAKAAKAENEAKASTSDDA